MGPAALFPYSEQRAYDPPEAPIEKLLALHRHLGISRGVIVQASCHGFDNSAMIDALKTYPDRLRGVALLPPDCTIEQIEELHAVGVRGVRFNFMSRIQKAPSLEAINGILERIAPFGWHAVLHFDPEQIPQLKNWIADLPLPHVIDHMGRLNGSDYGGKYFDEFCTMLQGKSTWMKISGAERGSETGPPFADMIPIARKFVEIAPDRTLWGIDWPHPVLTRPMPDDGHLVDQLGEMVPDETTRKAILVDNPARLYGF